MRPLGIPVGYECNQKTWDEFKRKYPPAPRKPLIFGEIRSGLGEVYIFVREGLPDGFHPVYNNAAK